MQRFFQSYWEWILDSFYPTLLTTYRKFYATIAASIVSTVAAVFYLVIGFQNLFVDITTPSQRWTGLICVSIVIITTYLISFYNKNLSLYQAITIWIRSNIITFFSFAYYIRLNQQDISTSFSEINTAFILIPLVAFVYISIYSLFAHKTQPVVLVVLQVMLMAITTFGFVSAVEADRTFNRPFVSEILEFIFRVPDLLWYAICSLAFVSVTILSKPVVHASRHIGIGAIFLIIMFQIFVAIDTLQLQSYWTSMLLVLIVWNFVQDPLLQIAQNFFVTKYKPRLIVSSVYHAFLFFVVLLFLK